MTDPVEVLARAFAGHAWDDEVTGSREFFLTAGRDGISALEAAGFKLIERPPPADSTVSTYWRDVREAEQKAWDAAPTFGDKP